MQGNLWVGCTYIVERVKKYVVKVAFPCNGKPVISVNIAHDQGPNRTEPTHNALVRVSRMFASHPHYPRGALNARQRGPITEW